MIVNDAPNHIVNVTIRPKLGQAKSVHVLRITQVIDYDVNFIARCLLCVTLNFPVLKIIACQKHGKFDRWAFKMAAGKKYKVKYPNKQHFNEIFANSLEAVRCIYY